MVLTLLCLNCYQFTHPACELQFIYRKSTREELFLSRSSLVLKFLRAQWSSSFKDNCKGSAHAQIWQEKCWLYMHGLCAYRKCSNKCPLSKKRPRLCNLITNEKSHFLINAHSNRLINAQRVFLSIYGNWTRTDNTVPTVLFQDSSDMKFANTKSVLKCQGVFTAVVIDDFFLSWVKKCSFRLTVGNGQTTGLIFWCFS